MALALSSQVLGLFLLGAVHGINPGMGWLFAVGRGFQEGNRRAVWRALAPLALGHGLAIAAALAAAAMIGVVLPISLVQPMVGLALVGTGIASLFRHRHPRGGGMRLGTPALAAWSFMMATAHGAGLMALPLVLGEPAVAETVGGHSMHTGVQMAGGPALHLGSLVATAAHAAGYLVVTALIAILVYQRFGLRMLRSAWINLDLFWAVALILAGGATLLV